MAKRFYRSTTDKKIAGICGALGEYFDIDSNIIRLIALIIAICTVAAPGVVVYMLAWIIFPEGPKAVVDTPR